MDPECTATTLLSFSARPTLLTALIILAVIIAFLLYCTIFLSGTLTQREQRRERNEWQEPHTWQ